MCWSCVLYGMFIQVCSALRASGVTIPIVAMTGNVDPRSIELFKRSGFNALLAKPFNEVRD
jgi:CheY-like chemotaxis protein